MKRMMWTAIWVLLPALGMQAEGLAIGRGMGLELAANFSPLVSATPNAPRINGDPGPTRLNRLAELQ